MFEYIVCFAILLGCLACSAIFSCTEMAFSSANSLTLENRAASKDATSNDKLVFKIKEDFQKYLPSILLGNNLVNMAITSLSSILTARFFSERFFWIGTMISTVFIIIFGEILPKIIGRKKNLSIVRIMSKPLLLLYYTSSPLILPLNFITGLIKGKFAREEGTATDEIECAVEEIENSGIIDNQEAELLQNSIDFETDEVYEVAKHRVDIEGIDIEDSAKQIKSIVTKTRYSRLIVYKGSADNILGVVLTTAMLEFLVDNPDANEMELKKRIEEMTYSPLYFHMTMKLSHAFRIMKKENKHIAVVNDEFGGTYGIVTMEDLLEELSGEIWDESDEIQPDMAQMDKEKWRVRGDTQVDDIFEKTDTDLEGDASSKTIGGLAFEMLDRLPRKGDRFKYSGLEFEVEKMAKRRVMTIIVTK